METIPKTVAWTLQCQHACEGFPAATSSSSSAVLSRCDFYPTGVFFWNITDLFFFFLSHMSLVTRRAAVVECSCAAVSLTLSTVFASATVGPAVTMATVVTRRVKGCLMGWRFPDKESRVDWHKRGMTDCGRSV